MKARWPWLVVLLLTVIGLALRWHSFNQSLLGDELSTLWIVKNNNLLDAVRTVNSDAEISPPLYFILAWFATRLGDSPELVRLPAMLAGVLSIPLMYQLGKWTAGRAAGLLATTIFVLSPSMIYFSANGRAYSLMTFMLICSTLTMLAAVRGGGRGWWVAFGVSSCLAMYSHYTAAFVLGGQLVWLLWAHPEARRAALVSTAAAAVFFLPWVPGLIADMGSTTTDILAALQGSGFTAKRIGVEQWVFGHTLFEPNVVPGKTAIVLVSTSLLAAVIATLVKGFRRFGTSIGGAVGSIPKGVVLILIIALATPVCEAVLALAGTDLLGSRNMTASWYGFALSVGALLVAAGPVWGAASAILLIAGFGIGATKMMGDEATTSNFRGAAQFIDSRSRPGDVVVDAFSAAVTPVPEPPLDLYLSDSRPEYSINLPTSPPPYLPYQETVPPPDAMLKRAFRKAGDGRVFLFKPRTLAVTTDPDTKQPIWTGREVILPKWAKVEAVEEFPSRDFPSVYVIRGKNGD